MVYKFESEFSDRLREEGNVIHYMDQSVPKTKNMPFVREDTILPGSEIIEKLVPCGPPSEDTAQNREQSPQNMLSACRPMHCLGC